MMDTAAKVTVHMTRVTVFDGVPNAGKPSDAPISREEWKAHVIATVRLEPLPFCVETEGQDVDARVAVGIAMALASGALLQFSGGRV